MPSSHNSWRRMSHHQSCTRGKGREGWGREGGVGWLVSIDSSSPRPLWPLVVPRWLASSGRDFPHDVKGERSARREGGASVCAFSMCFGRRPLRESKGGAGLYANPLCRARHLLMLSCHGLMNEWARAKHLLHFSPLPSLWRLSLIPPPPSLPLLPPLPIKGRKVFINELRGKEGSLKEEGKERKSSNLNLRLKSEKSIGTRGERVCSP